MKLKKPKSLKRPKPQDHVSLESCWLAVMTGDPLLSKQPPDELQITKQIFYSGAVCARRIFNQADGLPEDDEIFAMRPSASPHTQ